MSTWDSLDIWKITRPSKNSLWGAPTNLGPSINTKYTEFLTSVSPDGRWCYFESNRPGGYGRGDIWQAQIIPILEVNDERMMTGKEQQ
jgi:Tol biopolymer transport system component